MNLNLGCGDDSWGDVRLDQGYATQTGTLSRLNLRADAHNLPFVDNAFDQARCWHVLEHVKKPRIVVAELRRVSGKADIRFPVHDGYLREMFLAACHLRRAPASHAWRTARTRAHKWVLTPEALGLKGSKVNLPVLGILGYYLPRPFFNHVTWSLEWQTGF